MKYRAARLSWDPAASFDHVLDDVVPPIPATQVPSSPQAPLSADHFLAQSDSELDRCLRLAEPGDVIECEGEFQKDRRIDKAVRLLSRSRLGSRVGGKWTLNANGLRLEGFDFHGDGKWCHIRGKNIVIRRCRFRDNAPGRDGGRAVRLLLVDGLSSIIEFCEFTNCAGSVVCYRPRRGGRLGLFKRNWLHDIDHQRDGKSIDAAPIAMGESGFDCFEEQTDQFLICGASIVENLIENVNALGRINREGVMCKSNGNRILRNTAIGLSGFFNVRYGVENVFDGNWLEDSSGIFIFGDRNQVTNNNVIRPMKGNKICGGDEVMDNAMRIKVRTKKWIHPAARQTLVARNIGANFTIGHRDRNDQQFEPDETLFEANDVGIERGPLFNETRLVESSETAVPNNPAVKLQRTDVGVDV